MFKHINTGRCLTVKASGDGVTTEVCNENVSLLPVDDIFLFRRVGFCSRFSSRSPPPASLFYAFALPLGCQAKMGCAAV